MGKEMNQMIFGFIAVFVGSTVIAVIADDINAARNLFTTTEELALASGVGQTTYTRLVDCTNASNKTNDITDYIDTLFNCSTAGVITTQSNITGQWNVTYSWGDYLYVQDSTSRNILPMITILFAIGIMVAGVAWMYIGLKGMGIF